MDFDHSTDATGAGLPCGMQDISGRVASLLSQL